MVVLRVSCFVATRVFRLDEGTEGSGRRGRDGRLENLYDAPLSEQLRVVKLVAESEEGWFGHPNLLQCLGLFHHLLEKGDFKGFSMLVEAGADPDWHSGYGDTMLAYYAGTDKTETVRVLLDAGAYPNGHDDAFASVLQKAVGGGYIGTIRALLGAGADPNIETAHFTLLASASISGPIEIVEALLEAGADPTATDNIGRTAISYAEEVGNSAAVELLRDWPGSTTGSKS